MPLAWPRSHDIPVLAGLLPLLLLLLATDRAAGDHHHHHHPARVALHSRSLGAGRGHGQAAGQASAVALLNPWLSACDLADPAASPDLQGLCVNAMPSARTGRDQGPFTRTRGERAGRAGRADGLDGHGPRLPGVPPGPTTGGECPLSCAAHNVSECLHYFHDEDKDRLCDGSLTESRLAEFRLRHCCEHSVVHSLPPEALKAVLSSASQCHHYLGALIDLDVLAARLSCEFGEILMRFDCDHQYSVTHMCTHCQESYRRWVCSALVPHFPRPGGPRVRPCRSVCQAVEQKCPFFLPGDRAPNHSTQYAGEPTFLCQDPNIPESGDQLLNSLYDEDHCCYRHCSERGLPFLCPSDTSCLQTLQRAAEASPPAVVCEPPPPAPTSPPGERTLPSACAPSLPFAPPLPRSQGVAPAADRCLLGLIGALILYQLGASAHAARARVSSPARALRALGASACCRTRPRPKPWPRPQHRLREWPHRRPKYRPRLRLRKRALPERPVREASNAEPLLQLLKGELLRTKRLGKRTTSNLLLPLFCFVVHVT